MLLIHVMLVKFEDRCWCLAHQQPSSTEGKGVGSLRVGEQGNYVVRILVLIVDRGRPNNTVFVQLSITNKYKSEGHL